MWEQKGSSFDLCSNLPDLRWARQGQMCKNAQFELLYIEHMPGSVYSQLQNWHSLAVTHKTVFVIILLLIKDVSVV